MKVMNQGLKSILAIAAFSATALNGLAQQAVQFRDINFDEAMKEAKAEKKIIFVDVQGMKEGDANKKVASDIFTLDSVAGFFNKNVIAIHVNMNSPEGKKFAPRLAMLMYPVYVFHAADGDQLEFTNAYDVLKNPGTLMQKARTSLKDANIKLTNTRSIQFNAAAWKDLLTKAKKEHKMIFLDAYTEWCRPCIMMAKNVFTLNEVADYYNDNFINVSMDMEKGEGPALNKKYKIRAYPCFLYIDGNGKIVHRDGGYQESDAFIKAGKTAVAKFKGQKKG